MEPAFAEPQWFESPDALRRGYFQTESTEQLEKLMKPTPQISSNQRRPRGDNSAPRDRRSCPLTDYSFQSTAEALSRSSVRAEKGIAELRTFRKVSREYFGAEAGGEHLKEGIFFASIACVAAWPITVMMYELTRMMI